MKVRIFDTTLRDGEQTPGVALTPEQKLNIAKKLDELGVDAIEAGFPIISEGEMAGIRMIASANLRAEICGLARTDKKDIDAAVAVGLKYIHTFIATSDIHLKYKLKLTREEVLQKAIESVEYGKSRGLQVEFSAEDATRTDREFLRKVFKEVASAGADRIDIPDTVGYSTPGYMAEITKDAIEASKLPISVHCHNDFGLAVANAISGIQAGAQCAHVTINGIGERAGNASLEELYARQAAAEEVLKRTTAEFIFQKISAGLDERALLTLAGQMGLLDGASVIAGQAALDLRKEFDEGKLSAEQFGVKADELARIIASLQSREIEITVTTINREINLAAASAYAGQGEGTRFGEQGEDGLQFGGRARAGRPYMVGEAGPEMFMPQQSGFVMDNADTMRLIRALEGLSGGSTTINATYPQQSQTGIAQELRLASKLRG